MPATVPESNPKAMPQAAAVAPLKLIFKDAGVHLYGFHHALGKVHRTLDDLKREGLICNEPDALAAQGYRNNLGIGPDESLKSLAGAAFSAALKECPVPSAVMFHHSYPDSVALAGENPDAGFMARVNYFPPVLMREFALDHTPYLVSFASGCTGLLSMMITAAGLCGPSSSNPVICTTADVRPPGATYDAMREKILTSDCCSAFLMGREKRGYQLLGIAYYSTTRSVVPLVEIVKRSVNMIRELAKDAGVDLASPDVLVHYPNIFPTAWDMISNYLKIPRERHVLDGLAERAHCLSSDSMISLAKHHEGKSGRTHVVVNFGSGLHLGACILREEARP